MDFIIGLLIGGLLFWLFFERRKPSGTFIIDFSDVNKDIITFELNESLNKIYSKKYVLFKVKSIGYDSQN